MTAQPGTVGISHTTVGTNVGEILITFGQTVIAVTESEPGQVILVGQAQWLHTASMSPQVALQLQQRLTNALAEYAAKFGAIPQDPAFQPVVAARMQ